MNKQILTFYARRSNGVVAQIGHGYIRQQAAGTRHISVEANPKSREVSE